MVTSVPIPSADSHEIDDFPKKGIILVIGEAPGIKDTLISALREERFEVLSIVWGKNTARSVNGSLVVSPETAPDQLRPFIRPEGQRVGAIVNLGGISGRSCPMDASCRSVSGFFCLVKAFEKDLRDNAAEGIGRVIGITFMGGHFGLRTAAAFQPETAGISGIIKTVSMEWPEVYARCIDLDPGMEADMIAAHLLREITTRNGNPETGIDRTGRWSPALEEAPVQNRSPIIDSNSLLLVLGGGQGITAEIAMAAAARYQPRIIIAGRSILQDEPEQTRGITNIDELKSFFIRALKSGNDVVTPAKVNFQIQRLLRQRALAANIAAMQATGADVEYHSVDARNVSALTGLMEGLYRRFGRIDGVIHGAGVIDDRLIRDKSVESFNMVYDTKVIPALVLAQRLNPKSLKFLVFFSSVSGRFGNPGQSDYSAANEVLNKTAHMLSRKWPKTKVVSIGWGPWESGMVTEDLKSFYRKNNIGLIPVDAGVEFFFREIEGTDRNPEIVATPDAAKIADSGLGRVL